MKFTLKLSFVRFCGYYGYLINKESCMDTSNYSIDNIVFYKWNKSTKSPEVIWSFSPSDPSKDVFFNVDGKEDTRFVFHRKENSIKPKEILTHISSTSSLWIRAEAVSFKGPVLSKKSYVTQKNPETYGSVNYELATTGEWDGGQASKVISTDYLTYLNIRYAMESKLKSLRWEGGDALENTTKAIHLLQFFKEQAVQNMHFWSSEETTPEMLMEYVTKSYKEEGGDK